MYHLLYRYIESRIMRLQMLGSTMKDRELTAPVCWLLACWMSLEKTSRPKVCLINLIYPNLIFSS